ncbi:anthrone oxygenase family protein [Paraburkholderia sp. CI3]|uniref:anthrone oxygenase family protein n=1 Tax=Paraburkholderia sp. CI3 TaxID=2991060 RepID=UPI003D1E27E6
MRLRMLTNGWRHKRIVENSIIVIVILFGALATGGLIVNWIGLGRAMSRLSVSAYVEFHQHTNRTFDPYMPIVVIGALAGGVALAVMYGVHSIPGQLAAAGAVCYALIIIIGVPTCVRINHQIQSWSIHNPPREWVQIRARWIRFHVIRTLFSVPGLALYTASVVLRTA